MPFILPASPASVARVTPVRALIANADFMDLIGRPGISKSRRTILPLRVARSDGERFPRKSSRIEPLNLNPAVG